MGYRKTMNVRVAVQKDAEFIVQAQLAMALETEKLKLDLATVRRGVGAVFENPHHGEYYVAESSSDQLMGCLLTIPEWSDWRNGKVLWIHSVFISPEFRGQGVYKKMYEHLKELVLANENLRGLRLYVDHSNQNAQKVYQKLGMNNEHYQLYEWMKTF